MDIVITYVDGLDPLWQQDYARIVGGDILAKRFRDWGTLKYLLRGIEKNMPYVENVFLVVARESQVPQWVNREKLKIVLHSDFVPAEFLPTFNCNTLEMHLHRIPGLSEEYLYFNDDMYPVRPSCPETFFRGGKTVVKHVHHLLSGNFFKKIVKQSDKLARKMAGVKPSPIFIRPQHTAAAMLKSRCEELYTKAEEQIRQNITTVRTPQNLNQYLFADYLYYLGETIQDKISNKHFSLAASTAQSIEKFLAEPTADFVCINDVQMPDATFQELHTRINAAFQALLPQKSRFEL